MRKMFTIAALSLAAMVATPALAQSGGVIGGAIGGELNISTVNGSFEFNGSGSGSSESGSGFSTTLGGSNGAAGFSSIGLANALSTSSAFSSESTSFHVADAQGWATPNASFDATQVMTFAQGEAAHGFDTNLSANFEQTQASFAAFGVIGGFGF